MSNGLSEDDRCRTLTAQGVVVKPTGRSRRRFSGSLTSLLVTGKHSFTLRVASVITPGPRRSAFGTRDAH